LAAQGPRPDRYRSARGLLEAPLEAEYGAFRLAGRLATVYSYNEQIPGPVLEARAGDTVRVPFTNNLPEPTNIHFHGLHVEPTGRADNIFLEIPPGESLTYEFTLPAGHPAGTYWFHPHIHGRTARQLSRGMAGLFIVRGELDDIPEIAAATEYLLMLKDFEIYRDGSVGPGSILTVNGVVNPRMVLQQNGLLRLRILNSSIDLYFLLQLEEHPLYLIATDGGGIPQPLAMESILIAPGQRIEVVAQGDRPGGVYRLLNLPYASQGGGMEGHSTQETAQLLATLAYEGRLERPVVLPSRLVSVDPLPPPTQPLRRFEFRSRDLPAGPVFEINGRTFDHERVDTRVALNTIEEWEIINLDTMDHPIHLHTNLFQVVVDGEPERAWRDIINVRGGERRRFRVRFADFPGKTVYHCHRVAHGDLGMQGVVEMHLLLPPRGRFPR